MLVRKDIVMKSKKVVIISSLILFIFGFLLIVLGHYFNKMFLNPLMVELIKNLGFGIFCSSAVTFGISGPEYHIVKKKSLEKYLVESNKLLHSFLKVEYFQYETYEKALIGYFHYKEINRTFPAANFIEKESKNLNELKGYYKKFISIIDNESLFEEIICEEYKTITKKLNKVIESYIDFTNNVSIYELDSYFSELSFLSNKGNTKYKKWIFLNLHLKIYAYFDSINYVTKQLTDLSKDKSTNYYYEAARIIEKTQNKLCEVDTENQLNISARLDCCTNKIILRKDINEIENNIEILHSKILNKKVEKTHPRYYSTTSLIVDDK